MKLKDEVGMAGSESTQTKFVEIITLILLYIPTLAFFPIIMRLLIVTHWCYNIIILYP